MATRAKIQFRPWAEGTLGTHRKDDTPWPDKIWGSVDLAIVPVGMEFQQHWEIWALGNVKTSERWMRQVSFLPDSTLAPSQSVTDCALEIYLLCLLVTFNLSTQMLFVLPLDSHPIWLNAYVLSIDARVRTQELRGKKLSGSSPLFTPPSQFLQPLFWVKLGYICTKWRAKAMVISTFHQSKLLTSSFKNRQHLVVCIFVLFNPFWNK